MKPLRIRKIELLEFERHLKAHPSPKMERNFRKHVNRIKKTKWAHQFLVTGIQPKGKRPDYLAWRDFRNMGFEIPASHCPAVVYQFATWQQALLELLAEFLVAENNGEASSSELTELVGGRL